MVVQVDADREQLPAPTPELAIIEAFADAVLSEFPVKRQRAILARTLGNLEGMTHDAQVLRLRFAEADAQTARADALGLAWWRSLGIGWLGRLG